MVLVDCQSLRKVSYQITMDILISLLLVILVYLMIAYSLRWLEVSNQPGYLEEHPHWNYWPLGFREIGLFLLEYVYMTIHLVMLIVDYISIPLQHIFQPIPISSDDSRTVILIHGYMMRAGTMWWLKFRLRQPGRRVYLFSYSPPWKGITNFAIQLKHKVDSILSQQPGGKVDLVAHSMGGLVCRYYLTQLGGYERVEHLVTLGTPHQGSKLWSFAIWKCGKEMRPESPLLKTLQADDHYLSHLQITSIYTNFDELVIPQQAAELPYTWVKNKPVSGLGHVGLLFSPKVFRLIEEALADTSASI